MMRVSGVTKRFGKQAAISNVSFDAGQGAITALLGPNGAGKTTTMRVIAGYYVPDEGDVELDGVSVVQEPLRAKRMVGYLPESNPLYRDLTVGEHVTLAARLAHLSTRELGSASQRVIGETHLEGVYYRPVRELSKGFRQRVGLACALIGNPPVLVLDEPTEGLDPNQRTDLRKLLLELSQARTLILSTHVLSEAQELAKNVVLLNKGVVAAHGALDTLLHTGGTTRLSVVLSGKDPRSVLLSLPSVQAVDGSEERGGKQSFSVDVTDVDTFARALSSAVGAQCVIHELRPSTTGLAGLFTSLTSLNEREPRSE